MKVIKATLVLVGFLFFLVVIPTWARIGVGVGTGKIVVDEKLKAGTIYRLPSLTVINTGDETTEYEVAVTYHQAQKELAPPENWFTFSPQKFSLPPNQAQTVSITLNLPLKMTPGAYFAYLEGHPVRKGAEGITAVGIAAAAKLYFTVDPSSLWEGMYYRVITFLNLHQPWTNRIMAAIAGVVILVMIKKFFNIQVNLKK
ncbi:hypothetical protein M1116_02125 [Patescibacteria group bacterium]|nr:hypothetical protein [Patescibacteria group bacterium]